MPSTSSVGISGALAGGAVGNPGEGPKGGLEEEKGRVLRAPGGTVLSLCNVPRSQPSLWSPMSSPLHRAPPFNSLALFSTVLPGGCPACDTRALEGALLCLERHYAAFPLHGVTSFNGSHTALENAADLGGLVTALQVTHTPRARIFFPAA